MILLAAVLLATAALAEDTHSVETQCKMAVAKVVQATGMELGEVLNYPSEPREISSNLIDTTFVLNHPLVPHDDAGLDCKAGPYDTWSYLYITSFNKYPPSAWFNLVAKGGAARRMLCQDRRRAGNTTQIEKPLFIVNCAIEDRHARRHVTTMIVYQPLNESGDRK